MRNAQEVQTWQDFRLIAERLSINVLDLFAVLIACVVQRWERSGTVTLRRPESTGELQAKVGTGPTFHTYEYCISESANAFEHLVGERNGPKLIESGWKGGFADIAIVQAGRGETPSSEHCDPGGRDSSPSAKLFMTALDLFDPFSGPPNVSDCTGQERAELVRRELTYLAAQFSEDPLGPLGQFARIGSEDSRTMAEFEYTPLVPRETPALCKAFEKSARMSPERPMVTDDSGTHCYRQVYAAALETRVELEKCDVTKGTYVGVVAERNVEFLITVLSVHSIGAISVPIDPADGFSRNGEVCSHLDVSVIAGKDAPNMSGFPDGVHRLGVRAKAGRSVVACSEPLATISANAYPDCEVPLYAMATSGTTGIPKIIEVSCGAIGRLLDALDLATGSVGGPCAWDASPMFDASVEQWARTLRGEHGIAVSDSVKRDPAAFAELLAANRCKSMLLTPAVLDRFTDEHFYRFAPGTIVKVGGERLGPDRWHRLSNFRNIRAYNLYGLTESAVVSTFAPISTDRAESIGTPLPGTGAVVLDPNGRRVPIGAVGELVVFGNTSERYVPKPEQEGDFGKFGVLNGQKCFFTGDLVRRRKDGSLEYLARTDRQVKIRGVRIELEEVERLLLDADEVVKAVCGVYRAGKSNELGAFCVPKCETDVADWHTKRRVLRSLPSYLRPTRLEFVRELPTSRSGKVSFDMFEGKPNHGPTMSSNAVRATVREAWKTVLGVAEIGESADFFELEGSSLAAARIVGGLAEELGVEVPMPMIFQKPVLQEFEDEVVGIYEAVNSRGSALDGIGELER